VTQRRPPGRFDSRDYARAYSSHSPGQHSGSGSARLDLSQKGDLPRAGSLHLVQGRRRALKTRMGKGPEEVLHRRGLPRPWGRGAKTPLKRDAS
jgi:hypothetical protein